MKKAADFLILFCILISYSYSFAALTDQEKISRMRQLADPSPEKKIFYKWVSKKDIGNMLTDGKITPEIYKYFMQFKGHFHLAGPGLYSYSLPSDGMLVGGEILIQIETQPGYRYLDLSDINTLISLEEAGITLQDVHKLNSHMALIVPGKEFSELNKEEFKEPPTVLYETSQPAVVFKGEIGVKITPFTGKDWALSDLMEIVLDPHCSEEQKKGFLDSIKKEIQKKAKKYIALLDPDRKISKNKMNAKLIELAEEIPALFPGEQLFINVGNNLLLLGHFGQGILPEKTLRKIAKYMIMKDNHEHIFQALEFSPAMTYMSQTEKSEIVENTIPKIQTARYGLLFLKVTEDNLLANDISKIVDTITPLITDIQIGMELLKDASYREYYRRFLEDLTRNGTTNVKHGKKRSFLEENQRYLNGNNKIKNQSKNTGTEQWFK